jgi:hypothetical protein
MIPLPLLAQTTLLSTGTSQETGFIIWSPYSGGAALLIASLLSALGAATILLGARMKRDRGLPRPWTWLKVVIVAVWALQILIVLRIFKHIIAVDPSTGVTGPVLPVTLASAACTFAIVAYLLRRYGAAAAVGGAFAAAAAGPMVFELPFLLVVAPVASTPTNPGATLTIPTFLVIFTTLALLSFSSRAALTGYSLCFLGAMLLTFAAWALFFGLSYPSGPATFLLNSVAKVLGFATTAAMFRRDDMGRTDAPVMGDASSRAAAARQAEARSPSRRH